MMIIIVSSKLKAAVQPGGYIPPVNLLLAAGVLWVNNEHMDDKAAECLPYKRLINKKYSNSTKRQTRVTFGDVGGGDRMKQNPDEHHRMNHSGIREQLNNRV